MEDHNITKKPMNLVMFEDAMEHLTRVHRIIRLNRGNALLVGVSGSGKQSLAKLAAYAAGNEVFEITLTRGYDESAFREDLKILYQMLGVESKKVVFLFTDAHVAEEGFLELINNMLTSGTVPALYTEDEKDGIVRGIIDEVKSKNILETKENCWNYFISKCRDNLHVVLAMSPIGDTLRTRCRNFPGLVNNTVIDWFTPWPHQALQIVASVFLQDVSLPDSLRESIIEHIVLTHESVLDFSAEFETQLRRHNYVTPKNYLDYVNNYISELQENESKIGAMVTRLDGGLQKLVQASVEVDKLKEELVEAKVVVDQKTVECNELLEVISKNTAEVEGKQTAAQETESKLEADKVVIAADKAEAEAALEAAMPALEEAAEALKNLKKEDITEIRSFAQPHLLVRKVCECVVILRGIKDVSWKGATAMMADNGFLKSLIEFDLDSITERQMKQIREYTKDPKFIHEELVKISSAGAGLLSWVLAMVNYYEVAKTVAPKRKLVAESEKSLRAAEKGLNKIKEDLSHLSSQLTELRNNFAEKTGEQNELRTKAELMERRLDAASRLMSGLSSEKTRWTKDTVDLNNRKQQLVGDCLLTGSFLSYSGAFTFEFRRKMTYQLWMNDILEREIPLTQPFSLETMLTNEVELSQWANEGLPSDELSIQNGILTIRAKRFPLCIDPQMQAVSWIKRKEGTNLEGRIKTFNDSDFLKKLEMAIQYGFPFLFENLDEYIDPVIDNVLEKNIVVQGGRKSIKLGDKEVEWDEGFRLYMTSKLSNPHYGPEVFGKTMIINYGLTQQGLMEQLLNVTVRHERPDLEERRETLVQEMSENKTLLKSLEDALLDNLSSATGNILDNTELIQTLEESKGKSVEIEEKLEKAKLTTKEIETVRSKYKPVAKRGAVLFFVMSSMSAIMSMYEYSLYSFLTVFCISLSKAKKDSNLDARLRNVIDTVTYDVYNYTCTGLFEKHKLLFSFQMTLKIIESEGELNHELLDFLLKGEKSRIVRREIVAYVHIYISIYIHPGICSFFLSLTIVHRLSYSSAPLQETSRWSHRSGKSLSLGFPIRDGKTSCA